MRSQEKSRPGDLNGAPRGQAERGLGDFSGENITQEVQNVNEDNDHATTRKSPMEPAGTSPSTELYHLGDSARNIAQESQNVDGGGNRASAAQLAEYDQNNTCAITLIGVHCSYSPLSKDCINI